jgi:hypothetical protein
VACGFVAVALLLCCSPTTLLTHRFLRGAESFLSLSRPAHLRAILEGWRVTGSAT